MDNNLNKISNAYKKTIRPVSYEQRKNSTMNHFKGTDKVNMLLSMNEGEAFEIIGIGLDGIVLFVKKITYKSAPSEIMGAGIFTTIITVVSNAQELADLTFINNDVNIKSKYHQKDLKNPQTLKDLKLSEFFTK